MMVGKIYRSKIPEDPLQKRYYVITHIGDDGYFKGLDFGSGLEVSGYIHHLQSLYEEVDGD